MEENRVYEPVERELSRDEILTLAEDLALQNRLLIELKANQSTKNAEFAALRKETEQRISELSQKVHDKITLENVEVLILLDTPRAGMKSILRADNNQILRVEPMSPREKQGTFGFEAGQDPRPEE